MVNRYVVAVATFCVGFQSRVSECGEDIGQRKSVFAYDYLGGGCADVYSYDSGCRKSRIGSSSDGWSIVLVLNALTSAC